MSITIGSGAVNILEKLHKAGFDAYVVGGAVRDLVMKKEPHDYDFTTNATPSEIKKVFRRTVDTGIAHGTVTVIENGIGYEVTTYRSENGYSDSRHPDSIKFVTSLNSDLERRDFTINAMCFKPNNDIIDLFGGQEDINARLIRTVGEPKRRFSEDALRMMRAIRFAAVLGFEIEQNTAEAIRICAPLIKKVSKERVLGELNKTLLSDNPSYIRLLHELNLMKYILPELDVCFSTPQRNKYHIYNVGEHIMHATQSTPKNLILRWSALLHDVGKPVCMSTDQNGIIHFYGHHKESAAIASNILRRLRMDNDSMREIITLIENHDVRIEPSAPAVKRMLSKVGDKLFVALLELQTADNKAKSPKYLAEKLQKIESVRSVYETIVAEGQPYTLADLVVNGRDLIKLGFKAGREIGDTLKILLGEVIISPELNTRDHLLTRARELKRKNR